MFFVISAETVNTDIQSSLNLNFSKCNRVVPFLTEENYYSGFFLFEVYFGQPTTKLDGCVQRGPSNEN